ncbi:YfhO family protein [Iamia majanohamensis]|uniref:YfhO family protein n=1 Tax=Iamia majanohamensis TaxID=467976 RepID=A0AAE9Y7L4_9ACTN|nr:YfhO family protein [Iamia majanohamensis]WCO68224.1 YfhO family protein [Iamia majanohamensis]
MLVPFVVFLDALVGRRLIAPGDGHTYYLPLEQSVADGWRHGALPTWDAGSFAGSPLLGIHQGAALHPAMLLHLLLPTTTAHDLALVTALAVAGAGTAALVRRLTGDAAAAAVSGCAFALCGFQFAHLGHVSIVATTAWLPWALWSADRLIERLDVRRVAGGAVVVGLAGLSGHGQMLAYILVATLAYTVVAVPARALPAAGARVATMVAGGLGLAAVQLVPVVAALGDSDRSRLSLDQATAYSHDPQSLLVTVFPFLYGNARPEGPVPSSYAGPWTLTELSAYVGGAALVAALVALPAVRRDRRLVALLVVAAGSALVALGDSTPAGSVVHAVPGLGQMRSWARYTIGVQLAVSGLAGVGVARVRMWGPPRHLRRWVLGVLAIAAVAAFLPALAPDRVDGRQLLWAVGLPAGAALVGVTLLWALGRWPLRRGLVLLLVLAVSIDAVGGFGWWYRWRSASPTPSEASALLAGEAEPPWGRVPDADGGVDRYLWAGDPLAALPHSPRVASASGASSVTGMDPLAPAAYLEVTGTDYLGRVEDPDALLGSSSHLLDLLRVTVVARPADGRVERTVRAPALPEAFLVGRTRQVSRAEAVRAATGRDHLDPHAEAVVEGACRTCPDRGTSGPAGRAGTVRRNGSSADVTVTAERPALLVISEAWSRGWSATVDGEPAPVVRADGVVQGIPVPAGRSVVTLTYRPPGLRLGTWISAATAASLLLGLLVDGRRRQRQPSSQSRASRPESVSGTPVHSG